MAIVDSRELLIGTRIKQIRLDWIVYDLGPLRASLSNQTVKSQRSVRSGASAFEK
jgi:hypothetical protein